MLSSGDVLDDRYRLDERIATGGMGDVWRGTDLVLGRVVAIKVLRSAMTADPEFAARFYGEARMLAAFRHPGVVEVYDYAGAADRTGGHGAYLVMGYVDGEPLSARLTSAGRLTVAETLSIVTQAADALHAAHQNGIVHRDVKPGNLVVRPNGTVILVDFGIARSAAVTSVTSANAIVGTALYMAPEQVSQGNVSPATDIYALGAVTYHCLAGHPPFQGDNALQVALRHLEDEPPPLGEDVPEAVRRLVVRAMAKRPEDRFPSAAAFAHAALEASGSDGGRRDAGTTIAFPAAAVPGAQLRGATGEAPAAVVGAAGSRRRQAAIVVATLLVLLGGAGLAALAISLADDPSTRPIVPASSAPVQPTETARAPTPGDGVTRTRPRPGEGAPRTAPTSASPSSAPTSEPASTPPETPPTGSEPAQPPVETTDPQPPVEVPADPVPGDEDS